MTPFERDELRDEVLILWRRLAAHRIYPGAANVAARLTSGWSTRVVGRVLADLEAEGAISWDDAPPPPSAARVGLAGYTEKEQLTIRQRWNVLQRRKHAAILRGGTDREAGPTR